MQREAQFLNYKPSQNTAAALILALNICHSRIASKILAVAKIPERKMQII